MGSWNIFCFFFSSRRRHTRSLRDWSSDVCSSDLHARPCAGHPRLNSIAARKTWMAGTSPAMTVSVRSGRALQLLGAFAVIAATLLNPFQAAIGIASLVGIVLIDAGMHAS